MQRDLVAEARELKVTFKEIDELQDQLQKIQIWKGIVESWLNTKPEAKQRHKKTKLKNFLNEAKMLRVDDRPLPYGSPVWHRLASQLEYIEWLVKVEQLLTEFFPRTDVVEEGYEAENESIVMINANEDIHMQDDSAIIEIEGISFVAPVRCSKRLTLNQIAQLVEELEVKKFYDRTQSLRFKEQAPYEADSSMSIESDLSLEPKVFMPSQVNKFGFDLLPKAVKLLLQLYCEASKLNHTFELLQEGMDTGNEITVNDTAAVHKLLQNKNSPLTILSLKELWENAHNATVLVPTSPVFESIKTMQKTGAEIRQLEEQIKKH